MLLKRVIFHYFSDVPIVANNKDMILTMLNRIRIIICLLIIFAVILPELIQDKLFNGKVLENYNAWKRTSRIIPQRNVTNQCKFTWSKQYKSMQFFKDILEAPSTVKNEKNEDIAWYWIYEHEKKMIAWKGIQLTYIAYIIMLSWMFSVPQRVSKWLFVDAPEYFKDMPIMSIEFFCCDLVIFGSIYMGSWKIPLAITFGCATLLPWNKYSAKMGPPGSSDIWSVVRLLSWGALLAITQFMQGNMLYFVAQVNPQRFDEFPPVFDMWQTSLKDRFPSLVSFGLQVWKPADMEYEVLPILFLLIVNLAGVYPSKYFISPKKGNNVNVVEEAIKIVKAILTSHSFFRPIMFSSTTFPSQFNQCYATRFGYITQRWIVWKKIREPWKTMTGGCNDLVPSGHAIIGTICCLTIAKYRGGFTCWLTWIAWLYSAIMIVGEGHHYSIDIFIGFFSAASCWYFHHGEINFLGTPTYARQRICDDLKSQK